ncbi:GDSL-like Lipase/Acylhydrolase [compost metagenome]
MQQRYAIIRPGLFSPENGADKRRPEFDAHNEVLVYHNVPVDFVFLGDSITHYWDIQTYFGRKGTVMVNRGIGAEVTSIALRRYEADVIQLKPNHVVIKLGINNMFPLDAWNEEERREPDEIHREIVGDMAKMVRRAQENGIKPIVCSILPVYLDTLASTPFKNHLIISVNEALRVMSEELQAIYVDYHLNFVQQDGRTLRPELAYDGIHPNVYGYNIMADTLRTELRNKGITI